MGDQKLYDAIKASRTGDAWVTWDGERLRLRAFQPGVDDEWPYGPFDAFVKAKVSGGVALRRVWWHERRLHIQEPSGNMRRANDSALLAIVAERHPRSE